MKEVTITQCDHCAKTSFNKASIRVHEKKCFYNPATKSCATCLWFNRKHFSGTPLECFKGEIYESVNEYKAILNNMCTEWINADLVEDIDIFANERGILDALLAGNMEVLNIIDDVKANGISYYNGTMT